MLHNIFPSQEPGENIALIVRESWIFLFLEVFVWAVFAAALVLFNAFILPSLPAGLAADWGGVILLFSQLYELFLVSALFFIILSYYLNFYVITDIRIVDVNQRGIFFLETSELHISKIEDVTSRRHGFFETLFNYGDVFVQTAGALEHFEFNNVPNPSGIEKLIMSIYDKRVSDRKDRPENG
jgi:uncharacterized membrane protein YdbT with pleckstrin-like domain